MRVAAFTCFAVVTAATSSCTAFITPILTRSLRSNRVTTTSLGVVTAADAIDQLADAQERLVERVIADSFLDLVKKPDCSWDASDSANKIAGSPASLDARDAPGPTNIAWLSSLKIDGKQSSLTIFNGPLTGVPHLLTRVVIVDGDGDGDENNILFDADFRPRAYGAYETIKDDGTYPGPEELGREAFEYSGARNDFDTKFGNEMVQHFMKRLTESLQDATPRGPGGEFDQKTRGPMALSLTMPLTEVNIGVIAIAVDQMAKFWFGWALSDSHIHKPGAPVNTQYVYDSKYKLDAYNALLEFYQGVYGEEDGARLAAADSGPLDEAYVGGGS